MSKSDFILRAAQAMLDDIGNADRLNMDDPFRRIITVQLSSADIVGMLEAAIASMTDSSVVAEWARELARLEKRVAELEKNAHEPFDFADLVERLECLETTVKGL